MSIVSKLLQRARNSASEPASLGYAVVAIALTTSAVAAGSSALSSAEPAHNVHPAADVVAPAEELAAPPAPAPVAPAPVEPVLAVPAPLAPAPIAAPAPPPPPVYANNLDGWIRQSLDILAARGIPASYEGIMRNIMRESTGNPRAINLWDSNAAKGIPSKGLLQVIDPTFAAYHVEGTAFDIWDPVANIVAACNYAAHRYGSMDKVNSAY
ncbi:MAG TPA: transglycosylase SLT domain-containing protein [Aldersonia sp.]